MKSIRVQVSFMASMLAMKRKKRECGRLCMEYSIDHAWEWLIPQLPEFYWLEVAI